MSIFNPGGYIDPFPVISTGAETGANRAQTRALEVEDRLQRLSLACEAMWSLLRDKFGVTDEELLNRLNELDLSDGQLDGKVRKPAVACPKCGRTIARRNPTCMYCGQPIMQDPFA